MKILNKKIAQTVVEYILIGALVIVPIIFALSGSIPDALKNYFKGSTPGNVDSNGQLLMPDMASNSQDE